MREIENDCPAMARPERPTGWKTTAYIHQGQILISGDVLELRGSSHERAIAPAPARAERSSMPSSATTAKIRQWARIDHKFEWQGQARAPGTPIVQSMPSSRTSNG